MPRDIGVNSLCWYGTMEIMAVSQMELARKGFVLFRVLCNKDSIKAKLLLWRGAKGQEGSLQEMVGAGLPPSHLVLRILAWPPVASSANLSFYQGVKKAH